MSTRTTAAPAAQATTQATTATEAPAKAKRKIAPSLLKATSKKINEMKLEQMKQLRATQKEEIKALREVHKKQRSELQAKQSTDIQKMVDKVFESLIGTEILAKPELFKQPASIGAGKNEKVKVK